MKCHLHLRNPFCYSDLDEDSDSDFDTLLTNRKRSPLVRRRGSLDSSPRARMESASSTFTDLTESSSSPRLAISNGASMYALLETSSLLFLDSAVDFIFYLNNFASGKKLLRQSNVHRVRKKSCLLLAQLHRLTQLCTLT